MWEGKVASRRTRMTPKTGPRESLSNGQGQEGDSVSNKVFISIFSYSFGCGLGVGYLGYSPVYGDQYRVQVYGPGQQPDTQ